MNGFNKYQVYNVSDLKILNIVNSSPKFSFSFIVPPNIFQAAVPTNKLIYTISISINDNADLLTTTYTHTFQYDPIPTSKYSYSQAIATIIPKGYAGTTLYKVIHPIRCSPGSYQSATGSSECIVATKGFMAPLESMENKESCMPGYLCLDIKVIIPTRKCPGGWVCKQGADIKNPMAFLVTNKPDVALAGKGCPNRNIFIL